MKRLIRFLLRKELDDFSNKYFTKEMELYAEKSKVEKLEYFYRKHGFIVTFNSEKSSGSIRLNLDE